MRVMDTTGRGLLQAWLGARRPTPPRVAGGSARGPGRRPEQPWHDPHVWTDHLVL